ncbi:MAG: nitroreductase family protein [Nitrososphaerales archaeon]
MLKPLSPRTFVTSLVRILRGRPNIPPALQDNALLQTLLKRRTVRSFTDAPVPEDVFAAILEAGRLAPSTVNLQTWSFATFKPEEWSRTFGRPIPFKGAAAVIILADTHRARSLLDVFPASPLVEYTVGVMNASLAAMAMNIAAEALGVSSVMLSETGRSGFLDAGYLVEVLCLPPGVVPIMTIVFGYAKGGYPPMPPKLPVETVSFTGRYRDADPQVMQDWLNQMMAGYQASHLGASFQSQLGIYQAKIGRAEADLAQMVYHSVQSPG